MLKPDETIKINELDLIINKKIIPMGTRWNKRYKEGGYIYNKGDLYKADKPIKNLRGITIHNTPTLKNSPNSAEQYTRATINQNMGTARVHYYVGNIDAWQLLEDKEVGWHAGTGGNGAGNIDTIAIEIIGKEGTNNGAKLAAYLLYTYNLDIDSLYTHNHWMGQPDYIVKGVRKNCPMYIFENMGWEGFKILVKKYLNILNIKKMTTETVEEEDEGMKYETINDIKNSYYKQKITEYMEKGIVKGEMKNGKVVINLTDNMIRNLIFTERMIQWFR